MDKKNNFKPYISAEKVIPEFTFISIITGIILAVIFGGANAYLGLRVGMTVSASIPAAVISMGVLRILLRRNSILECNLVQTTGSAGESLAAGAIFTMPVLFLWAEEGLCEMPTLAEITLIALCGGVLGVLFMIPLRSALIVREHSVLLYPEGTACADVLLAGEKNSSDASSVFTGMGISAAFKFIIDGIKAVPADITAAFRSFRGEMGIEIYPALLSVGYIVGTKVASYMFAGSLLGWMVLIPLITLFGSDISMYPAEEGVTISRLYSEGGASAVWSNYVKYIGAGAIAAGGIISLAKSLPLIFSSFHNAVSGMKKINNTQSQRTAAEIPINIVLIGIAAAAAVIWLVPVIPVSFLGTVLIIVFGFFFAAVSARMVGLIGSSNNPVSGMCIATLLVSSLILKSAGITGIKGMTGSIAIGSVICIIAAIAGDTSQDLKTGYLLGATPKKQQIGELIGIIFSAFTIGGILYLLNEAWGYGSSAVPAPQATLMKMLVEGIMGGQLPWNLVFTGVFLAIVMEILRIPVMPFAIGLYLPIYLNTAVLAGGIVRFFIENKKNTKSEIKEKQINRGTLYCAGMIAGEGLIGILLAVLAIFGINLDMSSVISFGNIGGIILLFLIIISIVFFAVKERKSE